MRVVPKQTSDNGGSVAIHSGTWVDRYQIVGELGEGGMGQVYLAQDTLLSRRVALKSVHPDVASRIDRGRLIREARRAADFSDPHVSQVLDVVEDHETVFLVLEYIEGETLRDRLGRRISLEGFWDLAVQCVEAVEASHRAGIVHRDIKPENFMVTPSGQVKILDFGIARTLNPEDAEATRTIRDASGTPPYMAPEVLLNKRQDARTDIFSLGVVFFEMLAGERPFRGSTVTAVTDRILHEDPPSLTQINSEVPEVLAQVVACMLAKDPEHRYPSATRLLEDLVAAHRGDIDVPTIAAISAPDPAKFSVSKRKVAGTSLALLIVLLLIPMLDKGAQIRIQRLLGFDVIPATKVVAVLPMQIQSSDPAKKEFVDGVEWFLSEKLHQYTAEPYFQVVWGAEVRKQRVQDPDAARAKLGANLAFEGSLAEVGNLWHADLKILDTAGRHVLHRREVQVSTGQPFELLDAILESFAEALELAPEAIGEERKQRYGTASAGAMRFYLRGLSQLKTESEDSALDAARIHTAIETFHRAVSADPEFLQAQVMVAYAYQSLYEISPEDTWLELGLAACREVVAADPGFAGAFAAKGRLLESKNLLPEAASALSRAVDLNPSLDYVFSRLSWIYGRLGDVDRQEKTLDAAVAARPKDWRPHWRRGSFYYRWDRYPDARKDFEAWTRLAPDYYRGHANLGAFYVFEGRYAEAVETLERSIALHPTGTALSNLGTSYFNIRDFDHAIATYQRAVQHEDVGFQIWANLGDAYFWAPGKRELARKPYEEALRLGREAIATDDPDPYVLAGMADIFPKLFMPDSARVYMERALAVNAGSADIQYTAALVHWQLGEGQAALDWLKRAVDGGYSLVWFKDSAVFDAWREEPRFQAILETYANPGA